MVRVERDQTDAFERVCSCGWPNADCAEGEDYAADCSRLKNEQAARRHGLLIGKPEQARKGTGNDTAALHD